MSIDLSIITISYNNLDGLKKTAKSVAEQTEQGYEWIVVDGGSYDTKDNESAEFLKTTNSDWKSEKDQGIYDAMNKGIERATRSYMLFLNAGDTLVDAYTLESIKEIINQNPSFIYGDSIEQDLDLENHMKAAKPYTTISRGLFTHHQAMIYKKNELRYDLEYKIASDYDFTYRYLMEVIASDLPVYYMPEPLCIFEAGGVSQKSAKLGRLEQYNIRTAHNISGAKRIYTLQVLAWIFRNTFPKLFWMLKK